MKKREDKWSKEKKEGRNLERSKDRTIKIRNIWERSKEKEKRGQWMRVREWEWKEEIKWNEEYEEER